MYDTAVTDSFNLNLLECKFANLLIIRAIALSFNLNLLECKCAISVYASSAVTVLISTYWNVNPYAVCVYAADDLSFNLNLLECKSKNHVKATSEKYGF